jgi:hypothetical protein
MDGVSAADCCPACVLAHTRPQAIAVSMTDLLVGWIGALNMAVIARAFARAFPAMSSDVDQLTIIAIFCGLGLLASLLIALCRIDLSSGFRDLFAGEIPR